MGKHGWKRILALTLCLVLTLGLLPGGIVTAQAESVTSNLLPDLSLDGGAEASINGWTLTAGKVTMTTAEHHSGTTAAVISSNGSNGASLYCDVTAPEAGEYTASVWVKGSASVGALGLYVFNYDTNGHLKTGSITTANDWTLLTCDVTIPEGTSKIRFWLNMGSTTVGTFCVDDMTLVKKDTDTNLLPDFSLNDSTAAKSIANWTLTAGKVAMTTAEHHSGTTAAAISSNGAKGASLYCDVAAPEAGEYTASVWVKGSASVGALGLYVYNHDTAKHLKTGSITTANDWTLLTYDVTVPEGTSKIRFWLNMGSTTVGTFYVDDMTLVKKTVPTELTNTSFEDGFTGWNTNNSSISLTGEKACTGTHSVKLEANSKWVWSDKLQITAGESYQATAKITGDATALGQILLRFYGSDKKQVSSAVANFTPGETWKTAKVDGTAPADAAYADVLIVTTGAATGTLYFDDVTFGTYTIPVYDTLQNGDFETLAADGSLENWMAWGQVKHSADSTEKYEGSYSLKLVDEADNASYGVISDRIKAEPWQNFEVTAMAREDGEWNAQVYIRFYAEDGTETAYYIGTTNGTGNWERVTVSGQAMPGTAYAQIWLVTGNANVGTVWFDDVTVTHDNNEAAADVEMDWEIAESGHPRLYYTPSEQSAYRSFAVDSAVNAFGYSGKLAFDDLKAEADAYVAASKSEGHYTTIISGTTIDFGTWQTLSDPNKNENVPCTWVTGYKYYPCLGSYLQEIQARMERLALVYSITGDTQYAELAIQYAMDVSNWSFWGDYEYVTKAAYDYCEMNTAYLTCGVAAVYDMCFDQLTDAQKTALEEAIVEKGLEPLYKGTAGRIMHNYYANYISGLMTGACAIVNESNLETLGKYLDRAYNYMDWYLDQLYETGDQEGYLYTAHSVECMVKSMAQLERVTGQKGLLDHDYFTEILVPWVVYFAAADSGILPAYSDSEFSSYFGHTMSVLNKETDNGLAGWYLKQIGGSSSSVDRFLYTASSPKITAPEGTLKAVEAIGYAALRTGWTADDQMLTLIANNSQKSHNHYDQNSFLLAVGKEYLATDVGYASTSLGGNYTNYATKYSHSTIFVDGKAQGLKGNGSMTELLDNPLYSYVKGSAPEAYGTGVLTQFDRYGILINHEDSPYYVIIDDLDSETGHTYGWNLNAGAYSALTVDGNSLAVETGDYMLYADFAGENNLTVTEETYSGYGPTIRVSSGSGETDYQFLSVLSVGETGKHTTLFAPMLAASSRETVNSTGSIHWSTSSNVDNDMVKLVTIQHQVVFFRGAAAGDWISFDFDVEEAGTYHVSALLGRSSVYGKYQLYVDGVACGEVYDGYSDSGNSETGFNLGELTLTAGTHTLKLVLQEGENTLIGVAGVTLAPETDGLARKVELVKSYDNETALGAEVQYGDKQDLILFNRGDAAMEAGGVSTDARQLSLLGLESGKLTEGYAAVSATKLTYGRTTLLEAEAPATVVADFRDGLTYTVYTETEQTVRFYVDGTVKSLTVNGEAATVQQEGSMVLVALTGAGEFTVKLTVNRKSSGSWLPILAAAASAQRFTDVENGDWYYDAVEYVAKEGIMDGVGNRKFATDSTLTRAMVVTILWRMEGEPVARGGNGFSDVPADQWYTEAVAWAASQGIVGGYGNGKFGPNDPVTREQLAAILCRYTRSHGETVSAPALGASVKVSGWAKENVGWAAARGLYYGATGQDVTVSANRAEVAYAIYRLRKG